MFFDSAISGGMAKPLQALKRLSRITYKGHWPFRAKPGEETGPVGVRLIKSRIEELLFKANRHLFSELDFNFMDATFICFEGDAADHDAKPLLETRPVYHPNDANIACHAICFFLELILISENRSE